MLNILYLPCPHCEDLIEIPLHEINCRIYRHGVWKHNFQQIDPHTPKHLCEEYVKKELIYGCGKPFCFNNDKLESCDYI
jgi:hypothetical protein